ncbi:MAG: CrcB family protein [Actinobacteria bacterium]|nr:CrcB family protein [Actinomycetota bacterium]
MKKLLLVACGAAVGSFLRYLLVELIGEYPLSILLANLLGVALAGVIALRTRRSESQALFWIPGFCGGLTTFSSVAVIHAEKSALVGIGYFYGTVVLSMALLFLIAPKVKQ